jgi:predicted aspartyl protease
MKSISYPRIPGVTGCLQFLSCPLALAITLGTVAMPAAAACKMIQVAELATGPYAIPLVPVSLDGHATTFLVDTGAGKSMIWRKTAEAFRMAIHSTGGTMYGMGGTDVLGTVWVHELSLGGAVIRDIPMYASGRSGSEQVAGLLGADFLSAFDIEFDLGKKVMRLFNPQDCKGDQVVYWANSYAMVPLVPPANPGGGVFFDPGWVIANVSLNGQDALAMFDTGAALSTVTSNFIRRGGIPSETVPIEEAPEHGIAGKAVATEVATFSTLTVGQENLQHARLRIADLWGGNREAHTDSLIARPQVAPADMLIGADFFRAHRIYIAHSQKKMYFTYQGGPIFLLAVPQPTAAPASAPPAGAAAAPAPTGAAAAAPPAAAPAPASATPASDSSAREAAKN